MENVSVKRLIDTVISNSVSNTWKDAVTEWEIIDCEEDNTYSGECICGKENLKYLYTIENTINGNQLYPIGSTCINKFNRSDLNREVTLRESMFKLLHAVDSNQYLDLSTELFSRKLLKWLYEIGAFETSYEKTDAETDYNFMLKMFNKRDKSSITDKQRGKIAAVLLNSIKPFLENILSGKIK